MKYLLTLTFLCSTLISSLNAQTDIKAKASEKLKELPAPQENKWQKNVQLGDKLMEMGSVYNAIQYYAEALKQNPGMTATLQKLADGNFVLRDYAAASTCYKQLVDADAGKNKDLYSIYQYALTQKYLGSYETAKTYYNNFIRASENIDQLKEQRDQARLELKGCDLALELAAGKTPPDFKVSHLDKNINQPFTDYAPLLADAQTLYFGSWISDSVILEGKREKYASFSRIYSANRTASGWSKGEEVKGDFNQVAFHTGNPALTPDGNTLFYTQCYQDEYLRMRCSIYKSNRQGNAWSEGTKLDDNVNQNGATTTQPAVGKNEAGQTVLFFASDRNAGKGLDLFASVINGDGSMAKAQPLSALNTKGDDMTPQFDPATQSLYFASNGHPGIGGTDIFEARINGNSWTAPRHMGVPINSSVDDMYFFWSEKEEAGFVVSNRPGGFGLKSATCCDDIYQVERLKRFYAVKGRLLDAEKNNEALTNATVTLYDAATGAELSSQQGNAGYFFDLQPEKEYKVVVRKNGYEPSEARVSTLNKKISDTASYDISVKAIPVPVVHLDDIVGTIYWEFNQSVLTAEASETLDQLARVMSGNPKAVIEIGSHTDNKADDEYNNVLSQRRSETVTKYMVTKGISDTRITSKYYGRKQPVAPNQNPDGSDNPEGRAKNRRTEFKVVQE